MLGIARGCEEYSGFGSRGGRARIANVGGEEFSVDARGVCGRVLVNLCRSNVWRHETICIGIGGNPRRRRGLVGRRERARRHGSDEELDEDTSEEGKEDVNQ